MASLEISLSDEALERLRVLAASAGITPEEWARNWLEKSLERPHEDFAVTIGYVLRKNAELYRRLA